MPLSQSITYESDAQNWKRSVPFYRCSDLLTVWIFIIILLLTPLASSSQTVKKKTSTSNEFYLFRQPKFLMDSLGYHGDKFLDTIYYTDKKIKAIGFYAIDIQGDKTYYRVDLWTEFYNNGEIKSIGKYQFALVYDCCGGTLCNQVCPYKVGDWTYYYDNGKIKAAGSFRVEKTKANTSVENQFNYKSIMTSSWLFYDSNGQLANDQRKIALDVEKPTL